MRGEKVVMRHVRDVRGEKVVMRHVRDMREVRRW